MRYSYRLVQPVILYLLIIFSLTTGGCALSSRAVVADLSRTSPESILSRVRQNQEKLTTLFGKGHLTVETPEQNFKGQVEIRVRKPDSVLIVAQVALGMDVGFFFADHRRFAHYSPYENIYYTGPTDKMNRLVLFRMQVSQAELIHAVTGTYHFSWDDSARAEVRDNQYIFRKSLGGDEIEVSIDPGKYVVKQVTLRDSTGRTLAVQKFRTFRRINGIWLPRYIQIFRKDTRERLTIFYERLEVNKEVPAEEFTFKVPENARKYRLK